MSYTNVELVSHHLATALPSQEKVVDQPLVIQNDYVMFFSGPVEQSSVIVKSVQSTVPSRVTITLSSGKNSVASSPLVAGSVVVASDSSLGTVYTENVDYVVDDAGGNLYIKDGGDLSQGQTVTVWFVAYTVYADGSDYQLDADRGCIKRLSGGSIAAGETVHLDYTPIYKNFREELLTGAVLQANGMIEREIDPDGQFGADPVLQASATYQALEIVCRASAAGELARQQGHDRTATVWLELAEAYSRRSEKLLRSFRPPHEGPAAPVHG